MTEPERVNNIINILSNDFVSVVEDNQNNHRILGLHPSGKRLFIDALIRPKNTDLWANKKSTVFGIEFKKDHQSYSDKIKHISQAIDYSNSIWQYKGKIIPKIPILLCPAPFLIDSDENSIGYFVHRLLGKFNVGAINDIQYSDIFGNKETGISITMSATKLWDSNTGVNKNALINKLKVKVGSR